MASEKPSDAETKSASNPAVSDKDDRAKPTTLGEDDEFEDFPVEDWPEDQTEAAAQGEDAKHLWEESWDDDDMNDDFSQQLKEELKKVEAAKKR